MEGFAAVFLDGVGHQIGVVTAVVVDYQEILFLNGFNNFLHVGGGELALVIRGNESCQGLRQNNTVGASLFQLLNIADGELRAFFQQHMQKLRLVVAKHHGFAHIYQPSRKAEGADGSGKNGSVLNFLCRKGDGLYKSTDSSGINRRNGKCLGFFHGSNQSAPDCWNFIVKKAYLGTKGFRFYGKVHEADSRRAVTLLRHKLHAVCLKPTAVNKLPHRHPFHIPDSRKGQDGKWFFCLPGDGIVQPFIHIQ